MPYFLVLLCGGLRRQRFYFRHLRDTPLELVLDRIMASGRALDLFRKLDQSNAVIHLDAKDMAARTFAISAIWVA